MRSINSTYWARLQEPSINICELIELATDVETYRWTTANVQLVSSGFVFDPFPGNGGGGIEESSDMGVSVSDFTLINSSNLLSELMQANGLELAELSISRVFVDTPDLGRMYIFRGKIADYSHTRNQVSGQARNVWGSNNVQWPYYTYMDTCAWRFGSQGCTINPASYGCSSLSASGASTEQIIRVASGALVGSYANTYMDRGRLTIKSGVNSGQIRGIYVHSGDSIELFNRLPYACSSGDIIQIDPGCRKRLDADCSSKFNNSSHFLGFPWIPKQEQAF